MYHYMQVHADVINGKVDLSGEERKAEQQI